MFEVSVWKGGRTKENLPSFEPTPGMALRGRGPTKSAAWGGGSVVWSSGLCRPEHSFASMRLQAMPAEVRNPASACKRREGHLRELAGAHMHGEYMSDSWVPKFDGSILMHKQIL